ncbi:MAG: hypothetical protein LBV78_05080 [Kitasatospora sp.]|nr:hypothetical protein [Kitasatospora sp.]
MLISAAVVACASSVAALADNPPPGQVLSNFENHYSANIVRDCGYSQPLPAHPGSSLWLFCDTDVYGFNAQGQWTLSDIIAGSTAAEGPATPGNVPTGLSELSTPGTGVPPIPNHNGPAQFLPTPSGLVTSGGLTGDSANHAYAASWVTGVTRDAARPSDLLISFNNYCVQSGGSLLPEGFGLATYAPATNTRSGQVTVFTSPSGVALAQQERLGSPIFAGGYLYLFASLCNRTYDATCISDSGNAVYLARVSANPSAWDNAGGYRWYAGPSSWTASPGSAVSVISGARPLSVTVSDFSALGHGLALIEQTNIVGGFTVFQASRPSGMWQEKTSGTVPCTIEGDGFCRSIIGHPELSTRSRLLVSFFNPGAVPHYNPSAGAEGHVTVAAFPW